MLCYYASQTAQSERSVGVSKKQWKLVGVSDLVDDSAVVAVVTVARDADGRFNWCFSDQTIVA